MNADDSHSAELLRGINIPSITYGIRCEKADVRAADIEICARNIEFEMLTPNGNKQINVSIPGLFNVFNAMLAASVCMKLGIDLDTIAEGLKSVKGVSGRMESLPAEGFDFSVILDFAHTPDGLSNLLSAVQGFAKGRVIAVFGCGSGILAIASLLLGADSATGVDIDELAVKTAEENGKMNGFGNDRLKFIHGDLADKVSGKFDIVVANIVADVIIMFCKTVPDFMADNAVFITSGIIDIREQEVVDAFTENGFEIIARHADGGWRCFECRRKK